MALREGYVAVYKRRLRALRETLDMNRETLSQLSGVSVKNIRTYEVQLTSASVPYSDLLDIALALETPLAFFTEEKAAIMWDGDKVTGKSRSRKKN